MTKIKRDDGKKRVITDLSEETLGLL